MIDYYHFQNDLVSYFSHPARKTYWLYFITSFLIGVGSLYFFNTKSNSFKALFKKYMFNKSHWLGESPLCDYYLVILNSFLRVTLIIPFFMSGNTLSFAFAKWLMIYFDDVPYYTGARMPVIIGYTFSIWIVADFSRFFLHYLAHKIAILWEFHKVHHSATVLNPFTLYRQHPVEMFLFHIRGTLVFAFVTGIFYFFFSNALGLIEVLGINLGRFVFLFLGANLRHSHVPIRYSRFLEHLFISPLQHQIHHSIDSGDYNKNMGSHLAIWDWMFGTLKISEKDKQEFDFGIPTKKDENYNSFWGAIWIPIRNGFRIRK